MNEIGAGPARRLTILLFVSSTALLVGCSSQPKRTPVPLHERPCEPRCARDQTCHELDQRLVEARQPMLRCVGREAHRGRLGAAHRCYRSLRLIESARWWLRTLTADNGILPDVYRGGPVESMRQVFLCRVEQLARARTPAQVEARYIAIIRAYP